MGWKAGEHRKLYSRWNSIKSRCYSHSSCHYKYYGGKGITVCDEWRNSFEAFARWALENGFDENAPSYQCTIDRIDGNKGYSPDNCRIVSMAEQANNRCSNVIIYDEGKERTFKRWCLDHDLSYKNAESIYLKTGSLDAVKTLIGKKKRTGTFPGFFEKVQAYCKKNNLTIAGFERLCGIGNGVAAQWGKASAPSMKTVCKIADATGIPATEWLKHD